jgi:hypothetical protein
LQKVQCGLSPTPETAFLCDRETFDGHELDKSMASRPVLNQPWPGQNEDPVLEEEVGKHPTIRAGGNDHSGEGVPIELLQ